MPFESNETLHVSTHLEEYRMHSCKGMPCQAGDEVEEGIEGQFRLSSQLILNGDFAADLLGS